METEDKKQKEETWLDVLFEPKVRHRFTINGKRVDCYEIPVDPFLLEQKIKDEAWFE